MLVSHLNHAGRRRKLLASRTSIFVDDAFKFGFEVCRWHSGRAVSVRLAALSPHDRHDQGDEEGEKCDGIFEREHGVYRRGQRGDLDSCRLQGLLPFICGARYHGMLK